MHRNEGGRKRSDLSRLFRSLKKLRVFVIAMAIGIAGTAGFTYKVSSDAQRLAEEQQKQVQQIQDLREKVSYLMPFHSSNDQTISLPTFCVCISKTSGPQKKEFCPAKNDTCDKESREVCQARYPDHQC